MINKEITKQDILKVLDFIDKNGIPSNRKSTRYNLLYKDNLYPPKYVLSIAAKVATGKELEPSQFNGGKETNSFLINLGFTIKEGKLKLSNTKTTKINICTAIIENLSNSWIEISNNDKFEILKDIVENLNSSIDIVILPAGFINTKNKKAETIFAETEQIVTALIESNNDKLHICLGIDGRNKKDQLAITINNSGIIAIGRKFYHMDDSVFLADNPFSTEQGKQRIFQIKEKIAYLAVCYDIFGISKKKLQNIPNCDFIIGLIHKFDYRGGESDFARKGLAGASKQWNINIYASSIFEDRNPTNWPSGITWRYGDASVKDFKYDQIRIKSQLKILTTDIAKIYLRTYKE